MKTASLLGDYSFGAHRRYLCACVAAMLLTPGLVSAQTPPDAGSVLRQIEQQQRNPLPPKSEPQFMPPPLQSLEGATVTVSEFHFAGNTLLTREQLTPVVASFTGHPIDFAELQNAAIAVATTYRQAGWIVRVYLPQQDVTGGTVTIQIVEAKFGAVQIEGHPKRVSASRLKGIARTAQTPGAPLNAEALDRSLLLINDMPGVIATGRLSPGENQAETDLLLAVEDGPLVSGEITADNAGARFTGAARVIADASLNGRLGIGDRANALLLFSEGSEYMRLAYSLPVGTRGWRVGANASRLNYDIVTREFSALDAHGRSTTTGLDISYPLLRSRLKNLYLALDGDDQRFDNKSAGQTSTRYSVQTATLSVYGNLFDTFLAGGSSRASIALVQGRADLSGSPNEAADALTTRTDGSFRKLRVSASRLQALTERVSLVATLGAQIASKNLTSSEKLYLGGSQGVRAYPENEAGGSEGLLLNLEARTRVMDNINVTGFFDWGKVRVNKENEFPGAVARNSLDLKGVGLSASWVASSGLSVKATVARRIGNNPNPTSTGDDQDGSLIKNRFWLQASMPF